MPRSSASSMPSISPSRAAESADEECNSRVSSATSSPLARIPTSMAPSCCSCSPSPATARTWAVRSSQWIPSAPALARRCFSSAARKRASRSIQQKSRLMPASLASSIISTCQPPIDTDSTPMILARVVGTVVATQKRPQFEGAKLLLVQPETPQGEAKGVTLLAIDSVGAGVGERVIVVLEGRAAGEALGKKLSPVDAAIVGIVDQLEYVE